MMTDTATEMRSRAENKRDAPSRIPYPSPAWTRSLSIVLALVASSLFFTHSRTIAALYHDLHVLLPALLMWGTAIGFIHGVGFVPNMNLWRTLFHPLIGWLLMLPGITLILSHS